MQVLVDLPWDNAADWLAALRVAAPAVTFHSAAAAPDPARIEVVIAWAPAAARLASMTRLRAIIVPGAGVDQVLGRDLPPVPILRLADPLMAARMAQYVLAAVLDHHRGFADYRAQARRALWRRHQHRDPGAIRVGLMGYGVMGHACGQLLRQVGYDVAVWTRRPRPGAEVAIHAGREALPAFLARSEILVCLLPLTSATRGILAATTFAALPRGALLVNVARGAHLVVPDLLTALARDQLCGAVLDVFEDEPLPPDSPLWHHPKITVTPHIASLSHPHSGAREIARALAQLAGGGRLPQQIDRAQGY